MVKEKNVITEADRTRLREMADALHTVGDPYGCHLRELDQELIDAEAVPATDIDADVVTMNSRVRARDLESGRTQAFTLVYHGDSAVFDDRLSVLTPLGVRVLGRRVGDLVEWPVRRGVRRLRIEAIVYQPEAAGDFER